VHPLAQQFAQVAGEYERGRPGYPPAVVGAIAAELKLRPGAKVLDLAAGTGKLTRALDAGGLDVIAVEPLEELRVQLAAHIDAERIHAGFAEEIPLRDASVQAVTVADGFHWFQHERALAEIARVLSERGGLAVLNTAPDWSGASWAHEVGTLFASTRGEHPNFDGPRWEEEARAAGIWSEPRVVQLTISQPAVPERIPDLFASMSWIASLPDTDRAPLIQQVRELVLAGETPAEMPVHYHVTLVTRAV
jgi:SAM-dependent methyltransferase